MHVTPARCPARVAGGQPERMTLLRKQCKFSRPPPRQSPRPQLHPRLPPHHLVRTPTARDRDKTFTGIVTYAVWQNLPPMQASLQLLGRQGTF